MTVETKTNSPKVIAVRWIDSDGKVVKAPELDSDGMWPAGVPLYRAELVYDNGQVWREPE